MRFSVLPLVASLAIVSVASAEESKLASGLEVRRDNYEREIQRETIPITRRYIESLKQYQRELTKVGKLDEAVAVREEIGRVSKELEGLVAADWSAKLVGTTWRWWEKERLKFESATLATVTGRDGKPKLHNLRLKVVYESNTTIVLTEVDRKKPLSFRVVFDEGFESGMTSRVSSDYEWRIRKIDDGS